MDDDVRTASTSIDPDEAEAAVDRLSDAITAADADAATDLARRTGAALRANRRFRPLLRIADAAARAGSTDPAISRLYAQALIEEGLLTAALATLEVLAERAGGQDAEVDGLIGRAHKQRYVDQPPSGGASTHLRRSIEAYLRRYEASPRENLYHGVNAVAMLARADRDGLAAPDDPPWRALAERVLADLDAQAPEVRDAWHHAIRAECLVALGRFADAAPVLMSYCNEVQNEAFAFAGTLRQLEEVWQLDEADPAQRALIEFLEARLLRAAGGAVSVGAESMAHRLAEDWEHLEAVFGDDDYQSVSWYRAGLEASRSVVRIKKPLGATVGTGFVLPGGSLHPSLADRQLVVTNFHVANRDGAPIGRVATQLRVVYEDNGTEIPITEVVWQSAFAGVGRNPPEAFDIAVLAVAAPPAQAPSYVASPGPLPVPDDRVYVIGYPLGEQLSFSLNDNELVGASDAVLHYRAPTRSGSSGSPVFDATWQVIGVHHGGHPRLPCLDDRHRTYEANEGFVLAAVCAAIQGDLG